MNTSLRANPPGAPATMSTKELSSRFGGILAIALIHLALIYAVSKYQVVQIPKIEPKEMIAVLIAPEPPKAVAPAPQPPAAKPEPTPEPPKRMKPIEKPAPAPIPAPPKTDAPAAKPTPAPVAPEIKPQVAAPEPAQVPAQPKGENSLIVVLKQTQPDYPQRSQDDGEEGEVLLRILIDEEGKPQAVSIAKSSGYPRLDRAAERAGWQILAKPKIENGKPVAAYGTMPFKFKLDLRRR